MKKVITERFQQLAGIKPLYIHESDEQVKLSDSDKKHLTNKLTEFIKDEIIGDGMSGENLSAALKFLASQLEDMPDTDKDDDGIPDAVDDDKDKSEPHQFGLTGDQSDFGGNNPNR
tara:strand:+ start:374 stop:721 length:348 start_codon:yes stop_codon:yes gene_type:complete